MNFNYSRPFLKILPFVILIFVSLGCQTMETVESTKIPQAEITQNYVVTATRQNTRIAAYFNQGTWGKSVDLDAPSKIEYNGGELPQSSATFLRGTVYEINLNGAQTTHRFVYTNGDGKIFRNEMSFEPLDISVSEINVSRSQETKIGLSRRVGKDETITISLESEETRPASGNSNAAPKISKPDAPEYDLVLNNELDENRSAIILKPKNLKTFVTGKAVLRVEVSREFALQQQNPAGGKMRWSYSSAAAAIVTN